MCELAIEANGTTERFNMPGKGRWSFLLLPRTHNVLVENGLDGAKLNKEVD
jgi:hypothetical protein